MLAAASLLAVFARLVLTLRENAGMLVASRHEALTDALTGLGNRRALTRDLDRVAEAPSASPLVLALFDLDGFKHYNDSFGHPAGDALLQRLGRQARARTSRAPARAYRMGGDEFCVAARPTAAPAEQVAACRRRRSPSTATASPSPARSARSRCPARPTTPARRCASPTSACTPTSTAGAARRAARAATCCCARWPSATPSWASTSAASPSWPRPSRARLELDDEQIDHVRHAAELHDVGKMAIPDAILDKPGPLDDAEWEFIRRHTIIGERIVAAAPALRPVAALVRSSHERWDGAGYPDGLAGEEIPLGARIVAVCDAFDAMVADRALPRRHGRRPTRSPSSSAARARSSTPPSWRRSPRPGAGRAGACASPRRPRRPRRGMLAACAPTG